MKPNKPDHNNTHTESEKLLIDLEEHIPHDKMQLAHETKECEHENGCVMSSFRDHQFMHAFLVCPGIRCVRPYVYL